MQKVKPTAFHAFFYFVLEYHSKKANDIRMHAVLVSRISVTVPLSAICLPRLPLGEWTALQLFPVSSGEAFGCHARSSNFFSLNQAVERRREVFGFSFSTRHFLPFQSSEKTLKKIMGPVSLIFRTYFQFLLFSCNDTPFTLLKYRLLTITKHLRSWDLQNWL